MKVKGKLALKQYRDRSECYQFENSKRLLKIIFVVFGQKRCFDGLAFHSPDMSSEVDVREFGERVVIDVRWQTAFASGPLDVTAMAPLGYVLIGVKALPLCVSDTSGLVSSTELIRVTV